jgi:hypothetical protein
LYLTSWEEGAKGPEGKSSWKELKSNFETFEMLLLGIPEKAVKIFSVRKTTCLGFSSFLCFLSEYSNLVIGHNRGSYLPKLP